ncbi:MAG: flagellar assembly protein A [Spirochaetota bacterium]
MSIKIKGKADITITDNDCEVKLTMTPDPSGEEWDVSSVLELLAKKQVREGFNQGSVENALTELSRIKAQPAAVVIARGLIPEPPVPEEVKWEALSLPENLISESEKVFQAAGFPNITKTRVEKVKVKKKVLRKSKLPLMPLKEEILEVVEKRKIEEKVDIDPVVTGTAFVQEGMKLAVIYPEKPGKPGKTVFGAVVLPDIISEPSLYAGRGIERKGGEIISTATGFLRRGKNWAEIIPFQTHDWKVYLSKDNATCLLDFKAGNPLTNPPSPEEIYQAIKNLGYPADSLIPAEQLKALIYNAVKAKKDLNRICINLDLDSAFNIEVTEDKLKATLTLRKGRGKGKPLILKDVAAALRVSRLKDLDFEKIKQGILDFYRGQDMELKDFLLVEGKSPTQAKDTEVTISVPFLDSAKREVIRNKAKNMESLAGIQSMAEFPMDDVQDMAMVVRNQPVLRTPKSEKGQSGMDVYGKAIEGLPGNIPAIKLFENVKLEQGGVTAETVGILDIARKDDACWLRVRPHRDGECSISISEDTMSAALDITPAEGTGEPVTLEMVNKAIAEKGIKAGIDSSLLSSALEKALKGEPVKNLTFAVGRPPIDGTSHQLKFLVDFASGEKVKIRHNGSADYKNLNTITTVKAGQIIAKLTSGDVKPEDGWDITGKKVTARTVQSIDIEFGSNIKTDKEADGSTVLSALKSGELVYERNFIDIKDIHPVNGNVNLKTGNIRFSGAVRIKGSVETGFFIIAGDGIFVGEGVEAALLTSDGDIVVGQGIKGAGKAVLRTKKNIRASFIEHATLLAVGDITIKNFCLRSHVKCNGKLSLESDKGNLVGGLVRARKGIEAMNLGSESGVRTEISFGQDYLIADQMELEGKEIEKVKQKLLEIDAYMKRMEKSSERNRLEQARQEKLKMLKLIEKRGLRLFSLKEKFEEHFPSEIVVKGTIYPGVIIESHGRFYQTKTKKTGVTFIFDPKIGQIAEKKSSKNP